MGFFKKVFKGLGRAFRSAIKPFAIRFGLSLIFGPQVGALIATAIGFVRGGFSPIGALRFLNPGFLAGLATGVSSLASLEVFFFFFFFCLFVDCMQSIDSAVGSLAPARMINYIINVPRPIFK